MDPDELAAQILPQVRQAIALDAAGTVDALRRIAVVTFVRMYTQAGGDPAQATAAAANFVNQVDAAIAATRPDSDPLAVARMIAMAAVGAATNAANGPGAEMVWRTMRDDRVRELHRPMDGQRRPVGTPFIVGGTPMLYPGQPVGPPEGWINCRCRLVPAGLFAAYDPTEEAAMTDVVMDTAPDPEPDELEAAISDRPWGDFSASDYTIAQWHRACLLHDHTGAPTAKSQCRLPVREPNGNLNRNGVHSAAAHLAGARTGGMNISATQRSAARRALRGLYRQLGEEPPQSLAADGAASVPADDEALVAVNTHDAPGWVTNPRETERLRRYWTRGEGAAKIAWGTPGDFNRCRAHLGKYVAAPYLAGTCANLHYVALGYWPATHAKMTHGSADEPVEYEDEYGAAVTAAFEEVAMNPTGDDGLPPIEWFQSPGLTAATPATVDGDRYFAHLATWGVCHVGVEGSCTTAPRSAANYAYFRTGSIETTGGKVPVGQITMDTGHAERHLGPADTVRHYDDTGTVVADVAAGEDEHGIWVAGALRPGITPEQRRALQAGALSGDWRRIGGNLELVAALVVNVPGFPIPRTEMAASAALDEPLSLVAAAIVTVDPNAAEIDRIAVAVVRQMREDTQRRQRVERLQREIRRHRAQALVAAGAD